jgi:hypothetical protein
MASNDLLTIILQQATYQEQRSEIRDIIETIFYNKPYMDEKGLSFTIMSFLPEYPYSDYFKSFIIHSLVKDQSTFHNYHIVDDRTLDLPFDERDWLLEFLKYPHCFKAKSINTSSLELYSHMSMNSLKENQGCEKERMFCLPDFMEYTLAQCRLFQILLSISEQKNLGYQRASILADYICDTLISTHFPSMDALDTQDTQNIQEKWKALSCYDIKFRNKYGFYKDPRMIAIHLLEIVLNDNRN